MRRRGTPSISVPAELGDPHPLVRAAAARLKRRDGWDHPAGVRSAPTEVLDLQVTRNSLIDSRLSGIVAAIVGLAEAKRAKEEEEERRRRTYQEAHAREAAVARVGQGQGGLARSARATQRSDLGRTEPEAPSYWRF